MKAIICTKYGPPNVLEMKQVEKPSPKDNEVLIRIHATTVSQGDCDLRSLRVPRPLQIIIRIGFGFRGPRKGILGQELSGEIESVGKDVKRFKAGDQVYALTGFHLGAYAEYSCLAEKGLMTIKPANMTYEEAATIPLGGLHAFYFLKKANIQKGQKVLINGAGGSIGTFAVQLARSLGAEVTAVDSTRKLDVLLSIGADHVIDYTKEDFTKSGVIYDVIFDIVGKSSFSTCMGSLGENGIYLLGNPGLSQLIRAPWKSRMSSKKVIGGRVSYRAEDLISIREVIEAGKVKAVIDRRYPIEQIIAAHSYVDTGEKTGNVVITV